MTDLYGTQADTVIAPARKCFVITPNDTTDLDPIPKAIRADGDGVIVLKAVDSQLAVSHPVKDGEIISVRARVVMATGTSGQTTIIGYA